MTTDDTSDDEKLAEYAGALLVGLRAHTYGWVERSMAVHLGSDGAAAAATSVMDDVRRSLDAVAELLATDIDQQTSNPLAELRRLVAPMTAALSAAGAAPVARDVDAERLFPDDHFDLTPGAFSDIHPDLQEPGLAWGAAKAHVHLQRRRAAGQR